MADDKKPPKPIPVHRDFSNVGRKTNPQGMPAVPAPLSVRIEGRSAEREDETPVFVQAIDRGEKPPEITNEDLAMQVRAVDKKHEAFAASTTLKLATIEPLVARVPAIEGKVDQVLLLSLEKAQKQEITSMDVYRAHVEMQAKDKEVAAAKEIVQVEDKADDQKARRAIRVERWKLIGKLLAIVASSAAFTHFIERC